MNFWFQGEVLEVEGGGVSLDRTSYHYLCQDVTTVKTKLLQLKRILNSADTINPFDTSHRVRFFPLFKLILKRDSTYLDKMNKWRPSSLNGLTPYKI